MANIDSLRKLLLGQQVDQQNQANSGFQNKVDSYGGQGGILQALLMGGASAASGLQNPNATGQILQNLAGTYKQNLGNQYANQFKSDMSNVMTAQFLPDPNNPGQTIQATPDVRMNHLAGVLAHYGQDPKDYQVFFDSLNKQVDLASNAFYKNREYDLQKQKADIEKTKFQQEQQTKQEQVQKESSMIKDTAQSSLDAIQEIKKGIGFFGVMGELPSAVAPSSLVPGGKTYSERSLWEANINNLLSQNIVNLMAQMKQASKTGATGFGQLNREELKVLQNASTVLRKTLDPKDAFKILTKMESSLQKLVNAKSDISGNGVNTQSGNQQDMSYLWS